MDFTNWTTEDVDEQLQEAVDEYAECSTELHILGESTVGNTLRSIESHREVYNDLEARKDAATKMVIACNNELEQRGIL